jgi:hypothetical protein
MNETADVRDWTLIRHGSPLLDAGRDVDVIALDKTITVIVGLREDYLQSGL